MDGMFHELLLRARQGQVPELQPRPTIVGPAEAGATQSRPVEAPHAMALLSGLADAASTYQALHRGKGYEDNAMFAGRGPGATAALVAASALAKYPIAKLVGKKFPGLARAIDANMGATQLGYAGVNLSDEPSATDGYTAMLQEHLNRSVRRQQGR